MRSRNWKNHPKSLCYCLTRTECTKMATELNFHGIKAIAFHSENNRDGSAIGILEEFKKEDGDICVLCCTTGMLSVLSPIMLSFFTLTYFPQQSLVGGFTIPKFDLFFMRIFQLRCQVTSRKLDEVDETDNQQPVCCFTETKIYQKWKV